MRRKFVKYNNVKKKKRSLFIVLYFNLYYISQHMQFDEFLVFNIFKKIKFAKKKLNYVLTLM